MRELWNVTAERLAGLKPEDREAVARIETSVIPCADHAEALRRLKEIEAEWGPTSKFSAIAGWPALQRQQLIPRPHEGEDSGADSGDMQWMVTTAVAAGTAVIRLDGFAPQDASQAVLEQIVNIGRSLRPPAMGDPKAAAREVDELRNSPSLRTPSAQPPEASHPDASTSEATAVGPSVVTLPEPPEPTSGAALNLGTLNLQVGSESEIAVSTNGTNIVVAQQCSYRNSRNGGQTFPTAGGSPGKCTGGDSSVAYGLSGNFYWATIGSNNATCPPPVPPATVNNCNNTQQMSRSTNNGASFSFVTNVIDCQVTAGCGFGNVPDQEHIAADRFNAGGSGDQVYLVFRKGYGYGISCSQDGGATWTAVTFHTGGSIDFPRITVSQNGTVFVVTNNGNNINLDSFSSCASGLVQNLNQVAIATGISQVVCPIPGLDRCNDGNILSSHTVAVDDTNPNHVYAAYAVNTVPPSPVPPGAPPNPLTTLGNEDVLVRDSINGGAAWTRPTVQVSRGVSGRRYQPWICATGGTAFVSWQDRRAATLGANDLTDYYSGSANLDGGGNLQVAATDFQIDGAADAQCASGWPCLARSANDAESCNAQPQLAGTCRHTPDDPTTDSNTPCDFAGADATVCPAMETCKGGGGCPKYADYTGNACLLGRLYNVWPSATNQPGAAPIAGNISSFFVETVVGPTPTTTTYTGGLSQDYHDTVTLSATLVLGGTSIPITGQTISFTLGTQGCSGITNASGAASCDVTLTQIPGPYTVSATFAGSGNYQASSDSRPFTITREETTLSYTGPTVIANGNPVTLTGVLLEDGNPAVPVQGRSVVFTLGTGAAAQTCPGVTDVTGTASCTIALVNQPLGPGTVADNFAGDAYYLPSSNGSSTILFAFLARGAFVVGDLTASGPVEFWGSDWSTVNVLTGGAAPPAFKGFAIGTSQPPACGSAWTTDPGNSPPPPDGPLPSYMGVVVSSMVSKSSQPISGNVPRIVVVTTNPGYTSDPGHPGTGTVVATYCP